MNKMYNGYAKTIANFAYTIESVFLFLFCLISDKVSSQWCFVVFAFIVFTLVMLNVLYDEELEIQRAYLGVIIACCVIDSFLYTYIFESLFTMFLIFLCQWVTLILFLNYRACVGVALLQMVSFTITITLFRDEFGLTVTLIEIIASLISILVAMWCVINVIAVIVRTTKMNIEQENSVDDLLNVVEKICDEARAATKSKSEFLSSMSHEIRTPINSVLGMNEMILRESKDDNIREYASNIESSGNMLLALINDILDFSKIESGKMEIVDVDYQLSSVINDLVVMALPRIEKKELEFNVDVDSSLPNELYGDEVRIRQIVTNLLTNAAKYTDEGSITLKVSMDGEDADASEQHTDTSDENVSIKFEVIDTGRGVKEEDKDKLFDAFQRVDQINNRSIEGTGLGLAITGNFVKLMNGKLGVISEYGKGSTFWVSIPQKVKSSEPIGDYKQKYTNARLAKKNNKVSFKAPTANVLVVDDNAMNLKVAALLLRETEIAVNCVSSGKEAIRSLSLRSYDVVLLDHMMPDMDGIETLAEMKTQHLVDDIPVIALTANALSGAREKYIENGFSDYLSKPIISANLESMLIKWLPDEKVIMNTMEDGKTDESGTDGDTTDEITNEITSEVTDELSKEQVNTSDDKRETTGGEGMEVIDEELGISYCADDEDVYEEVVEAFIEDADSEVEKLKKAFADKDITLYQTVSHGMKSASLTVGAKDFSEFAKAAEFACKDSDWDYVEANHEKLIERYMNVVEQLRSR